MAMAAWDENWKDPVFCEKWLTPADEVVELVPKLRDHDVCDVLDLGCGVGRHSWLLAREGFHVTGTDDSPTAIEWNITLVGADESFNRVIKFAIEESDGVTAVSSYLRRRTIEEFQIKRHIEVIPNFVDNQRFSGRKEPCSREHFALPDEKILMHASNFRPVKRVGDAVRIFERVRREIPAKLLLVGEGPERLFVQQLVKELKLSQDVQFLGEQDFIEEILRCADLFLLPSEQESFGLAALEAHASGVPVIATTTGGVPEVVVEGETGYLSEVGAIDEMSQRALSLLRDKELLAAFKTNARRLATEKYDSNLIIPRYEEFYRSLIG